MRRGGAAWAIVVALATCGVALAATPGKGTASCGPAQARTLASSSRARVYALQGIAYGCVGKPQLRLGRGPNCSPGTTPTEPEGCVGPVRVAGVLAAYGLTFAGTDFSTAWVVVGSLKEGKRVSENPAIRIVPPAVETVEWVGSLVLAPDGDVAWIGVARGLGPCDLARPLGRGCVLVRIQVLSRRRVLDSGRTIRPDSLKLHGSLLSWKHGSMTRTARLR